METEEEKARKALDELLKKVETSKKLEDFNELKLAIDDYLDFGYKFRDYVIKYNQLVQNTLGNSL